MKNPQISEDGVSELIGSIMLIAVLVMAVSIVGIYLNSQPRPEKIPSLHATIWNDTQKIYISHDGGDLLEYKYIKIYVDGIDKTSSFFMNTAPGQPWTTWSIGNVLVYVTGSSPVSTVQVIYAGGGSSAVGLITLYVGPVAVGGVAPAFVTAGFSGSPTSGIVPLGVQFTDTSTGPLVSWSWSFGDGGTSTEQNPMYTYSTPNTYTVSLTVSNGSGSSTQTRTNYITANPPPPAANFIGGPTLGLPPHAVTFTDQSTGTPTGWHWDFGDIGAGNTSTLQNPSHTYTTTGAYSVNLTVSNAGGSNTLIRTDYIAVAVPPVANFMGNPTKGWPAPLAVAFTDTSTGSPTTWNWTFGDIGAGNTSTLQNPSHTYTTGGIYSVNLTVTNVMGCSTLIKTNYIAVVAPPGANFIGTPTQGPAPLAVTFTDTSTGSPTSWEWNFGDIGAGNTSTLQNPSHTYATAGRYSVNLTATNAGGSNTIIKTDYIYVPVCFADNFNDGSIGSAWAFVGGTWTESGGVMSQTSIASADPKKAIISNTGLDFTSNLTITSKVRVDIWSSGDMARAGVSLFTNTADGNGYNILFHNTQNAVQFLDDKVAWDSTTYPFSFTTGTWYWFKLNMTSGTMYARIWADGSAEPANWPYVWARSGRTGFPALNGGSSAGGADYATASFDDMLVCAN